MTAVYEKLKFIREQSGLRQGQVAEFLGVTQTFVSKVETGERKLTVDQLEKLANLYGYSLSFFSEDEISADRMNPIRFAYRAQDVSQEDLKAIADISRIAVNSRFMADMLEEADD